MRAMVLTQPSALKTRPLKLRDIPVPEPKSGEVLIRVNACGVCRTDLHGVIGEIPPHKMPVVPGHQVVGVIESSGPRSKMFKKGDRVGAAWLHASCGVCAYCRSGRENLCDTPVFSGYDVDGGYAEFMKAREEFIYPVPKEMSAVEIAPLLCAGIVGYRSLKLCNVPKGGRLGLYGFGASAHVIIQVARYWGCEVYVMTRAEKHRGLALELGAAWAGNADAIPPKKLDSAILFAPAGEIVPRALESLDKGGTLALAGIYLSDVPVLNYQKHLFQEKIVRSVTANTREDGRELLKLAREIPIRTQTEIYPLEQANEALLKLESDGIRGAGVLTVSN